MPELPEVTVYVEALRRHIGGEVLEAIRLRSASLLKTVDPPIAMAVGRRVLSISRLAKRIVWSLEGDLHLVFHLMLSGRLRWRRRESPVPKKTGHGAFDFAGGSVVLTEAGTRKRAALHVIAGGEGLEELDRGGLDPLTATIEELRAALRRENRTLKRALTDQRILGGIGNAHSDEILLAARLSPVKRTARLTDDELRRLHRAMRGSLEEWIERLRKEVGSGFPDKVTAFHPAMKAHGKFGQACPQCGSPIQRIRYAENETNYCVICQTGGRLLKDRSLSRLLRDDWPRTIEELEDL